MALHKSLSFISSFSVGVLFSTSAFAFCDPTACTVTNFSGTPDAQIEAAIDAAKTTTHKTVFFPNGTYDITENILFQDENVDLKIVGESDTGVILNYIPTPVSSSGGAYMPSVFNIGRGGGYTSFNLEISDLTIDMSELRSHSDYLCQAWCVVIHKPHQPGTNPPPPPATTSSAHAIRVGNGWHSGGLTVRNVRINNAGGYGIGIQTKGNDVNADNVFIQNVHIENSGLDAIDTKSPDNRLNKNLTILDLYVSEVGQNDKVNAVGIDIRYDGFLVQGYTFTSQADVVSPAKGSGLVETVGIEVRSAAAPGDGAPEAAKNGGLRKLDIKNGNKGIFIDNNNSDIDVRIALVTGVQDYGVYVRNGNDIELRVGCSWDNGMGSVNITGDDTVDVVDLFAHTFIPQCPSSSDVGSSYRKDF